MGLFPTDAENGAEVINTNGTTFRYVAVDDKWIIVNDLTISDLIYNAANWDANTDAATKNAIRDKIEILVALITANCTVAEVEAVINAEIVDGQSIDLAIDSLIAAKTHNSLQELNAGDSYEHITQAQKDALHAIYTLEVHDNTKHNPNYSAEGHAHVEANITDLDKYTQAQVDAHNWLEADITDLDHDAVKILTKEFTEGGGDLVNADIMVYRTATGKWELEEKPAAGENPALDDVTDVTIIDVADNEGLHYDSGSSTWINQTAAQAGLSTVAWQTTQHNREIYPTLVVAQDAHTVGANYVYRQTNVIKHGTNSKTTGRSSYWHFTLPSDYVDGQNITVVLHYIISGQRTINYQWLHQYYLANEGLANASTPSGSYTSDPQSNHLNIETSIMTGTNLVGGCHIQIVFRGEDSTTEILEVLGIHLIVPVNTRD